MKKIIIGNWKMNKNLEQTRDFVFKFEQLYKQNEAKIIDLDFAVAPPTINAFALKDTNVKQLKLALQNISEFESGAYTGEISASMAKNIGAQYIIIGHSERRSLFNESDFQVATKAKIAIKHELTPVICVGETLQEYESQQTEEVISRQIRDSLEGVDLSKIIIAYEPIWAIGTGKTATPEQAEKVCAFIKKLIDNQAPVLYGGSVSPQNILDILKKKNIDGALVGGASLEAESFINLLTLNK
ncbi:Triosephosphate isomerase [Mesomycoplasma conjunctivae]|uniref:Triosephosphate isomerase n=2 Tax=Mesomycoplasma conjunctivae TaxID=45361 RepID=C5J5N7_MESCH|nr:triose-phosphate isomerase [Mesomycoplasma conjunctivae]CAT04760.1 Triosephosphate isomerase [Mesomycoplasma conjunctivae]VEU65783.1 Triosephosphate isomerase [Mesomycoplasma conjunctivae]